MYKIADLLCGGGGAGMGLHRAGFEVIGFDIKPQKNYPFEFHQGDALEVDLSGFDAVWASPPCQAYTMMRARHKERDYPDLVAPTRIFIQSKPYIIENVIGAPLVEPIMLCGSMFPQLAVKRHRLFESSMSLLPPSLCQHSSRPFQYDVYEHGRWRKFRFVPVYGHGGKDKARHLWDSAMGIDWMNQRELAQAVPPAYSEYLGKQLIQSLKEEKS